MSDPSTLRPAPGPPPLIFQWERDRGVRRRLVLWLFVVAAGHAAIFYLFRVTASAPARKPPPQQAVVFLPADDAEVRTLLSAIDDRYPGAVLRPEDYTLEADMEALAKMTPRSEPSWATHQPALKPFPQPLVPSSLPGLMQPGEPLLPETGSLPPLPPSPAGPLVRLPSVVLDEAGGARSVVQSPAWPVPLIDDTWPASGNVPFMIGVDPSGRPAYCLPVSPATGVDLELLRRHLMEMRFNTGGGGLQWIRVAVRW